MFGLKAIFAALKGSAKAGGVEAANSIDVMPNSNGPAWSVVTSIRDIKAMADEAMAQQFMRDGYVIPIKIIANIIELIVLLIMFNALIKGLLKVKVS